MARPTASSSFLRRASCGSRSTSTCPPARPSRRWSTSSCGLSSTRTAESLRLDDLARHPSRRNGSSRRARPPGVLEDVRAALNETYPDFFVDSLVDRTCAPLDREALLREDLFPAAFLRAAHRQRSDEDALVRYLQEAFLERGAVVSASLLEDVDAVATEAGGPRFGSVDERGGVMEPTHYLEYLRIERFGSMSCRNVGPLSPHLNVVFGRTRRARPRSRRSSTASCSGGRRRAGTGTRTSPKAPSARVRCCSPAVTVRTICGSCGTRNADGVQGDEALLDDIDRDTYRTMFSLNSDELLALKGAQDMTARFLTAGAAPRPPPAGVLAELRARASVFTSRASSARVARQPDGPPRRAAPGGRGELRARPTGCATRRASFTTSSLCARRSGSGWTASKASSTSLRRVGRRRIRSTPSWPRCRKSLIVSTTTSAAPSPTEAPGTRDRPQACEPVGGGGSRAARAHRRPRRLRGESRASSRGRARRPSGRERDVQRS